VEGPRFVDTPSARFRVRESGAGEVSIVFATDPPNVVEHYDGLLGAFGPDVRAVVVELPPFGLSRFKRGRLLGLQSTADAVSELLEGLDARPAILVFPCLTGFVALRVAADDPESVAGLVLPQVASWEGTLRWIDRVDRYRWLRTSGVGQVTNRLLREKIAKVWYAAALADPEDRARFADTAIEAFRKGARFPLATALQRFPRDPPRGEVAQPILAVWGKQDRSHRATDPEGLRDLLPQLRSHTCSDCGHFPELEDPGAFVRLVEDWSQGFKRRGGQGATKK
jgi:pimeloyl-ACP methyl ester carboxylesterase